MKKTKETKKTFATLLIGSATALLGTISGVGLYESLFSFPAYFSSPPASFAKWKEKTDQTAKKFWVPLNMGLLATLVLALVSNWNSPQRRKKLMVALGAYLANWSVTVSYFLPKIQKFINLPADGPTTKELVKEGEQWQALSWGRHGINLAGYTALLAALATPEKVK